MRTRMLTRADRLFLLAYRFMVRTILISAISRKSLRLSGESRTKHSNGQLVTHISAVSRDARATPSVLRS